MIVLSLVRVDRRVVSGTSTGFGNSKAKTRSDRLVVHWECGEVSAGVSQAVDAEVHGDAGRCQEEDIKGRLSAERRTSCEICKAGKCDQSSDSE